MAAVTLTTLLARVRTLADMVGSDFVADSELTTWLNAGIAELHDLLVSKFGEDYFAEELAFSTVSGTEDVALPAGFLKVLGVDVLPTSGSRYSTLQRWSFADRNRFSEAGGTPTHYRLVADAVRLRPVPDAVYPGKLHYVPAATALVVPTDAYEGRNGWEEYVVVDAAIRCLQKEESDVSVLMAQKAQLTARIELAASTRDVNGPAQMVDVDGCEEWA